MKSKTKLLTLLCLVALTTLVLVPTAQAFDGRSSDRIVIGKDEVINHDLYLAGYEIIVDGTVNGDLMAAANTVVVNGTVTGDLWAAANSVTVNGQVGDDLFAAATVVTIDSKALIGDDVIGFGASVETRAGSSIGGDLLIGAFQGLISGTTAGDLRSGTARLRLEGPVEGDAWIAINSADDGYTPMPMYFGPNTPPMPSVPAGLTFGEHASIAGKLTYTSPAKVQIPASVTTQVEHLLPPADQQVAKEVKRENKVSSWLFDSIRRLIALLIIGLLIARFLPQWIRKPAKELPERPWASLGVGFLALVLAPIALLFALGVIIFTAVLFGALTLKGLVGFILGLGLPGLTLAAILFVLVLSYLPQLVVAFLGGRWILSRVRPDETQSIYWPLILGILILAILLAIPILGGLVEFIVILFGLGAIALLLLRRSPLPPTTSAEAG